MKTTALLLLSVLTWAAVSAVAEDPPPAGMPYAERYEQVVSHLETGGDLLLYANVDGALRDGLEKMSRALKLIPEPDPDGRKFMAGLDRLVAFLKQSGACDAAAFGMSSHPASNRMYTVNAFLSVDDLSVRKPLWRVLGDGTTAMKIQQFFPASTVVARTAQLDLRALWRLVEDAAQEVGGDAAAGAVTSAVDEPIAEGQPTMRTILDSVGQEIAGSLQLATNRQISIPLGESATSIPEPSLLIAIAAQGDALEQALARVLRTGGMTAVTEEVNGTTLHSVILPVPLPFPLQPTLASHDGFLVCGSSPAIVKEALAAYGGENRLVDGPRFRDAFEGLPESYNGLLYVDRRLIDTVVNTQLSVIREGRDMSPEAVEDMRSLMMPEGEGSTAFVRVNAPDGFLVTGRNPSSGKQVVAAATIVPAALAAGIAVPAIQKAKRASRQAGGACRANLDGIRDVKRVLAEARGLAEGATLSPTDLSLYFPDSLPSCPDGGAYTLGAVGEDPSCSIEGH